MSLPSPFGGRNVDLEVAAELSRHFRHSVLDTVEVQYVEGQSTATGHSCIGLGQP